ncbi:MAG: PadR family transcriptional regulator [Actinomycetota bacterium]|nr:PadR family transcriptional regulator [Actinomycetota bacterium]MDA8073847.1 PadR family transcriptional regulator [Actinomycetota bacterium]
MNGVSVSRLMALGLLAEQGPMHGHRIRREAEETHVESWGGVSVGALYRELHKMADDGLIEEIRCEQVGGRPERTVYQISDEGRRELEMLRERAMTGVHRRPDPVGVALLFAGHGEPGELEEHLRLRRQALDDLLQSLRHKRRRLMAAGRLAPQAVAVFRRGELFLEAELAWHDEHATSQRREETSR